MRVNFLSSQNLNHEVAAKRIIDSQFLKILDTLLKKRVLLALFPHRGAGSVAGVDHGLIR